jgi:hypothetical protein
MIFCSWGVLLRSNLQFEHALAGDVPDGFNWCPDCSLCVCVEINRFSGKTMYLCLVVVSE